MRVKKILCLFGVVTVALISLGCGAQNSTTYEEQLQLMAENEDIIECGKFIESHYGYCAVTDLDRNCRLEMLFSHTEGSGLYAYNDYYEVNETYDGMTRYKDESEWTNEEAQILWYEEIDTYYDDEKETYYYIFDAYSRDGSELYYINRRALFLKDGSINSISLGFKEGERQAADSEWAETYWGADRETVITKEEYENAAEIYFDDCIKKCTKIKWIDCKNSEVFHKTTEEILEVLQKSLMESSFAQEAVRAVINFMFQKEEIHLIEAKYDEKNIASGKLLERLHFVKECVLRDRRIDCFTKERCNLVICSLKKTEWYCII